MHPGIIPNDVDFKNSFAIFKIEGALARFYLRAIEVKYKNLPEPEWVPNEELDINLEHVLPKNPGANWGDISAEEAKANRSRLGNLARLQRTKNTLVENSSFAAKKPILKNSGYLLTKLIAKKNAWGVKEIDERQKLMADYAAEIWTLEID